MIRAFKNFLLAREIERNCRKRRIASQFRSEASQRGVSAYWVRSAERTRKLFGGAA